MKPHCMTGQMFIVTVVFLVGLIFTVQQLVFQYTYLDMPSTFRSDDYGLLEGIKAVMNQTVASSSGCQEALKRIDEASLFIESREISGYSVAIISSSNCALWASRPPSPAPINMTISITSEKTMAKEAVRLYNRPR